MTGILAMAGSVKAFQLAVSITQFSGAGSASSSHTFPTNTAAVTGGTGSYSYSWIESDNGGLWSVGSPTGASTGMAVSGVSSGNLVQANLYVVVTDTITGATATSNTVTYTYYHV